MVINKEVKDLIKCAIEEDLRDGDITFRRVVKEDKKIFAKIFAKQSGIIAGMPVAQQVFKTIDKNICFKILTPDGSKIKKGDVLAEIKGSAKSVLTGERCALNFLQRLSGIATLTFRYVEKVKKYPVKILDTRKTTPTLRSLEKYAVRCGGGFNHRLGLFDRILIKENYVKVAGGMEKVISKIRKKRGKYKIEVEVRNLRELKEVLKANVDIIMLDNMKLPAIKKAVKLINRCAEIEVSGNVDLNSIEKIAKCGVDYISIGKLTHSAPALDISLLIIGNISKR